MTGPVRVVFVHGAWGSPGIWRWVLDELADLDVELVVADLPTMQRADATFADDVEHVRGLAGDEQAVLCAHSYGGAVVTQAGAELPAVSHLVYVAAAMPDVGESMFDVVSRRPMGGAPLDFRDDGTIMVSEWFPDDGRYPPEGRERLLGFEPRPFALDGAVSALSAVAWAEVPSTYAVATRDTVIHPDTQREMASRATRSVEIEGDHMPHVVLPAEVAALVRRAITSSD